uniref:Uncharacterized protein n=1 Tax=Plectus sambesii TaxID=2011161 RepID=A0A914USN1_9BILA
MCVTMLGQIVFMAIMFVGLVLTLVSMFTPGWRSFESKNSGIDLKNIKDYDFGIIHLHCSDDMFPNPTSVPRGAPLADNCEQWWQNQPTWEKVVIACMALAVLCQLIALIWTATTFCACCCQRYLVHPLPILACFATLFLIIAVGVFGVKNQDSIESMPSNVKELLNSDATISYSFYVACGAIVCMVVDAILGCIVVRIAKTPF